MLDNVLDIVYVCTMTKKEIEESIKKGDLRFCKGCSFKLPVTDFFVKKGKTDTQWRFNSPCKSCANIRRNREYQQEYHRIKTFGVGNEEYNGMLAKQNNSCAICKCDRSEVNRNFAVDHCHTSGKIRALLCVNCNLGLGNFKDSPTFLKEAVRYLKIHSQEA